MNELKPSPALHCANCEAVLQGEFCHGCGQSIHSVLRPISHMLEDAGDIFFHMDERIVHTVPPLYTKPGFLTLEYFSGRRVRYIAPFRLMFVFCLLCFFFLHVGINSAKLGDGTHAPDSVSAFAEAKTADEVHALYADQTADLTALERSPDSNAAARMGLSVSRGMVLDAANRRLEELKAPPISAGAKENTADTADPAAPRRENTWISDIKVNVAWLPASVNERLTEGLGHLKTNFELATSPGPQRKDAQRRIIEGIFGVLPQTMFIMIPVFALVLKAFFIFRRRLYVEHLIVALHSHAFLFFALMLLTLLSFAKGYVVPHVAFAGGVIGLVQFAMWVWIPVYLLLMQKRVYRQGWGMTILKYWLIGSVYFWLLLFALSIAVIIGSLH